MRAPARGADADKGKMLIAACFNATYKALTHDRSHGPAEKIELERGGDQRTVFTLPARTTSASVSPVSFVQPRDDPRVTFVVFELETIYRNDFETY